MGIFKAYDIRGKVPGDLDADIAYRIGRAAVAVLGAKSFVIGRDMRLTGEEIAGALMRGITDAGADATDMGLATTPLNYFAIGHGEFGAGAMVTASHNPAEWNGFKFSRAGSAPVSYDTGYGEIEKLVRGELPPKAETPGQRTSADFYPDYKEHILSFARGPGVTIGPLKVDIDAGNGMAGKFLPGILEELPCELTPLYFELDGTFPNHEANPLKAENMVDLQKKVVEVGADVGIAYDGDADRCMFVDEKGERISSDLITALLAHEILPREPGATVIYDLRSSRVVPEEIEKAGGKPFESRVGHSFMKQILRDRNCPFGGELSGHYYFRDHYYSDCADLAMIYVLRVLSKDSRKMSELMGPLKRYHATGEVNFELTGNKQKDAKLRELEQVFASGPGSGEASHLDGLTVRYADWWFNVRPSNTEPVLRLNLEADTAELRDRKRLEVEAVLKA